MLKRQASLFAALFLFVIAPVAPAQLYWDVNSTNGGSSDDGNATGTWNNANTNWTTDGVNGTTATQAWVADSAAVFSAAAASSSYAVHLADAESASGLTFNDVLVTLDSTGGTLTLSGTTPTIDIPLGGNLATITAPLAGSSGLTLTGGTLTRLYWAGAAPTRIPARR